LIIVHKGSLICSSLTSSNVGVTQINYLIFLLLLLQKLY